MKFIMKKITLIVAFLTSISVFSSTLYDVQNRGYINCGVSSGLAGFSSPDSSGVWQGLDADTCRAISAAVFGDSQKVKFIPLTAKERFTALASGEIDVLIRNTTWTATRDNSLGLNFTGVNYYDGAGFLVKKSLGVDSALELDGAAFCIQAGTTTELNVADYFRNNNMGYTAITFDTSDETRTAFDNDRCDVLTSDQSQLAALRIGLKKPGTAKILPEVISKEPLGPVVRQGDDQWFNIVKWTLFAMINAEELGVSSENIYSDSNVPGVNRLLGRSSVNYGKQLGISNDWAYNVINQVGNYGEVFERNVGKNSPLQLPRGVNQLWSKGGIMYAPPLR